MIWSESLSASFYITVVDPMTWRDIGRMEITGGSIERNTDMLLESADLDMRELPEGGEAWIRIWMDADQDGMEHVPLFTGLASAPERNINGFRNSYSVECYSVLKPANDVLTDKGYYIPADVPALTVVARLLRASPAPVVIEEEEQPRLMESVIAEDGETNLSLAQKVMDAIGYRLRIDGRGTIYLERAASDVACTFDVNANDSIENTLTDTRDWYSCPNVFRAISNDQTAIARDDNAGSPLSTVSRGREIWAEEASVTLSEKESIAAYARRKLTELQTPARKVSYTRRFYPDITVGDLIRINHPEIGINGVFRVTSQSLELGHGCRTNEEAVETGGLNGDI